MTEKPIEFLRRLHEMTSTDPCLITRGDLLRLLELAKLAGTPMFAEIAYFTAHIKSASVDTVKKH